MMSRIIVQKSMKIHSNSFKIFFLKKYFELFFFLIFLASFVISCDKSDNNNEIIIGFSQCFSNDEWRKAMNEEVNTELTLSQNKNIKLIFKNANGNTKLQHQQIEDLLNSDIDVLLVSPNEADPLTNIISRVYKKGIPVVVIDRNISNKNFSAFVELNLR